MNRKKEKKIFILFTVIIMSYRIYILFRYGRYYIDDDQALMWYGTAVFGHFLFPEPMFFGQAYGSMFESLIAVPFYWLHIPLYYAVPLATILIGGFPFFYLGIKALKKGRMDISYFILFLFLAMSLEWDILTSIPRSFISGFPFVVVGMDFVLEGKSKKGILFGCILAVIGILMTSSAIAVFGIAILFVFIEFIVDKKKNRDKIVMIILGGEIGLIINWLVQLFYLKNPDYVLHPSYNFSFNWDVLFHNLKKYLFTDSNLVFLNFGGMFCLIILIVYLYIIGKKQYRMFLVFSAAIVGSLFMLGLDKTMDYVEGSLLFGQTRMLLFVPFLMISFVYLFSFYNKSKEIIILSPKYEYFFILCFIVIFVFKIAIFENKVQDKNSMLYDGRVVNLYMVDNIISQSKKVIKAARQEDVDVIIDINDTRGFGYALAAQYYGEFIFYNSFYDRRTWVYHDLQQVGNYKCLLVSYLGEDCTLEIEYIENDSVVRWLEKTKGIYRSPY